MVGIRDRLVAGGRLTLTFDYPYREEGRRAPDRPEVLMRCHQAALDRLHGYRDRVVLAGKSMGGRIGGHLAAAGASVAGMIFLGYPLVSPGSGRIRAIDHLASVGLPMLFLAGSRDRLAPLDRLRPVVDGLPGATLVVIDQGDHSFKVPVRTGRSSGEVLDQLAEVTDRWMRSL